MREPTQDKIREMINGIKEFAWFPKKLNDGTHIWLDYYWAFYYGGTHPDGSLFLWWYSPYSRKFRDAEDATFHKLKMK